MNAAPCPACSHDALRAIADALAEDDLDRAMTLGLLDARPEDIAGLCNDCTACARLVIAARDERLRALAARDRYRARQTRLAERADARARKRTTAATPQHSTIASSLPPAAAAALARAKARVAAKPQPE
jgi:hypothetical protein